MNQYCLVFVLFLTSIVGCLNGHDDYLQQMWNNNNYRTHFYAMYNEDILDKSELIDLLSYPYPAGGFAGQTYGQVIDQIRDRQKLQTENNILQPTDGVKISLVGGQKDTTNNYVYNIEISNNGDSDLTFLAATIVVKQSNYSDNSKLGFTDFPHQFIKKGDVVTNTILIPESNLNDSIFINDSTAIHLTPEDHQVLITGVRITEIK